MGLARKRKKLPGHKRRAASAKKKKHEKDLMELTSDWDKLLERRQLVKIFYLIPLFFGAIVVWNVFTASNNFDLNAVVSINDNFFYIAVAILAIALINLHSLASRKR